MPDCVKPEIIVTLLGAISRSETRYAGTLSAAEICPYCCGSSMTLEHQVSFDIGATPFSATGTPSVPDPIVSVSLFSVQYPERIGLHSTKHHERQTSLCTFLI